MDAADVTPTPRIRTGKRPMGERLRIVVLGYIVRGPLGGMVWSNLQYLMGLARLGHEVYFVEDSDDYPSCYDPSRGVMDEDPTYGLAFAAEVLARIGLQGRWAYYDYHTSRWLGPGAEHILNICASADLVLNLCGVNPLRPWLAEVPVRVLVDEDPAFTQIRHLSNPSARSRALQHNVFFSFAENIDRDTCTVPDDGLPWRPTRQPVVLDTIAVTPGPAQGNFTTVMQWESYRALEHNGVRYGLKSDSFVPYLDLPQHAGGIFEIALGGESAPRALLGQKGWSFTNPLVPTRDPWTYQRYVQQSKGELSVAKHGYVVSRSGWFSERSVCYLASGRPVIVQETGFSDWLSAAGSGVVPFSTPEQALAGVNRVSRDYARHCQAARTIAEDYFDARCVLPRLLDQIFETTGRRREQQPPSRTEPASSDLNPVFE